jgi:uncharacterized protein (DUF779 family)
VARVAFTDAARDLLRRLAAQHGPLLFHQSGGCCDGSAPMCYPREEFRIGERDVLLGEVEDTPFYIGGRQYEAWRHTQLLIDVVPGRGSGFSLEAPLGVRFLTRSRVFSPEEQRWLEVCAPGTEVRPFPARGPAPPPPEPGA